MEPRTSQRRGGFHGDSYRRVDTKKTPANILVDHVYVAYDNCPTIYKEGPFSLDNVDAQNVEAVLQQFSQEAEKQPTITYPSHTVLRMDPYCVHDAGVNTSGAPLKRTFVKISFSKTKYVHLGNAHNNLFVYDWPMVPRKGIPYTKDAIKESSHHKARDYYIEIDPSDIDFVHKKCTVPWASKHVHFAIKKKHIIAELANEGDCIETRNDSFLVTVNVAQKGDYKVTFGQNDVGFVNSETFHGLYTSDPHDKSKFWHKRIIRSTVQLTKDVRMKAPWGTLQYAKAGDYLVYIHENDCYFVPKDLFEKDYEIID